MYLCLCDMCVFVYVTMNVFVWGICDEYVCMCVCVCTCGCVCVVCMYVQVYIVCMWKSEDNLGCWPSPSTLFETGSLSCLLLHMAG